MEPAALKPPSARFKVFHDLMRAKVKKGSHSIEERAIERIIRSGSVIFSSRKDS
jgi:hypothetical protein